MGAAFAGGYILSAEVLPTDVRALGLSACSQCARVGGFVSPLLLLIDESSATVPYAIWAALALAAATVDDFVHFSAADERGGGGGPPQARTHAAAAATERVEPSATKVAMAIGSDGAAHGRTQRPPSAKVRAGSQ